MKAGDLIKVPDCIPYDECFFCYFKSSRVGILLQFTHLDQAGDQCWEAKFDVGEWEISEREFKLYHDIYDELEIALKG